MVTPTILRTHVETDLVDAALQLYIDDAVAEIERRFGQKGTVTEEFILAQENDRIGRRRIWTSQKIQSVTSVEEGAIPDDLTALVAVTDFIVLAHGWAIERLGTDFQKRVTIVYVTTTDEMRRDRVVIDLSRLTIRFDGHTAQKVGDFSENLGDYQGQREKILSTLNNGRRSFA